MYVVGALLLLLLPSYYGLSVPRPSLINLRRSCGPIAQRPNHLFRGISPCQDGSSIVENARIENTFRDENGRLALTVICESGTLFPDGTTTRTIHNERGMWIVTEHCIIPFCTVPPISNAVLVPPSGTVNYLGSLNVVCNDGFILSSDISGGYTSYCLPDESWTRTESCVEILPCVAPTIEHASITAGPFTYNDEVTVTCDDGYTLCDGTNEYTAKCGIDGTWNRTDFCTHVVCAAEARSNTKLESGMLPDLPFPGTVSVLCDDDYETSDSARFYKAICTSSAVWNFTGDCAVDVPSCTIPPISNAMLVPPSGTVNYLGSLNVTCNDGFMLSSDASDGYVSYCLPDESWTRTESCIEILACVAPTVEHASLVPGGPFSYNDEVTVTCDDGYTLCDGTNEYTAKCGIDGTWNRTDCCTPVVCAAEARSKTKLKDGMLPYLAYPSTISVQCDDNSTTIDSAQSYEATCTSNATWGFTGECMVPVQCEEVTVHNTQQPSNVLPVTDVGDTVTVTCAGNLFVVGRTGENNYMATCTSNGWDTVLSCGDEDCTEVEMQNFPMISTIFPDGNTPMNLICFMGGAMIQFRTGITDVDFDVGWEDYVAPFGSIGFQGDYWVGLENIHRMTSARTYGLWVQLIHDEISYNIYYTSFSIGDASTNYTLQISGYDSINSEKGDSLSYHDGQMFTTKDRDNDNNPDDNCAALHSGGWWFNNCRESNLNGKIEDTPMGIIWVSHLGPNTTYDHCIMTLTRPDPPVN